jgi:hypothetical protein
MAGMGRFTVTVTVMVAVAGCSAPGAEFETMPFVEVQRIGAALHDPVWSFADQTLIGLTDDNRIAKADLSDIRDGVAHTSVSEPMADLGKNLQISPIDDSLAYVAEPSRDRVAVVDLDSLEVTGSLDAGRSPSYLALDSGARILLALDADGATVTPVDLHRRTVLPDTVVQAGPDAELGGANRGRTIEFHVSGPEGIAHYQGLSAPAHNRGELDIGVQVAAGDGAKATRSYVAEKGTDRLLAIDSERDGKGLTIVGSVHLGEMVRYLGTDDTRIYAVTDNQLVVLATNSFTGYDGGSIPVLRTVEFRSALPDGVPRSAQITGITIGPDRAYLTVADQPYVIGVAKPHV